MQYRTDAPSYTETFVQGFLCDRFKAGQAFRYGAICVRLAERIRRSREDRNLVCYRWCAFRHRIFLQSLEQQLEAFEVWHEHWVVATRYTLHLGDDFIRSRHLVPPCTKVERLAWSVIGDFLRTWGTHFGLT